MAASASTDFIIIGGGMAGATAAAQLSSRGRVVLLETEQHVGYHSTGRSAALFSALYGNDAIRALSRASQAFLFNPPSGFSDTPLVVPRPTVFFARADQMASLQAFGDGARQHGNLTELSAAQAQALLPVFKPGYLAGALLDSSSADIEVHTLQQGFLRQARRQGAAVVTGASVKQLEHAHGLWTASTPLGDWQAPVVVNAAGAWADEVAQHAGVRPAGLRPLRRTVLLIDTPDSAGSAAGWPFAVDVDEEFYFKPDAGLLLLSPADEHESPPCDAQPEDLDVAIAVDRFEQATGHSVRRVKHRWAGLRVFSPDRSPVIGFDTDAPGFFWLAGLGGYGIQTAVAVGHVAAALATGDTPDTAWQQQGLDVQALSIARLRG